MSAISLKVYGFKDVPQKVSEIEGSSNLHIRYLNFTREGQQPSPGTLASTSTRFTTAIQDTAIQKIDSDEKQQVRCSSSWIT